MELDCELIRDGLVGQPVNTLSSVAFVMAAAWLIAARPRSRLHQAGAVGLVVAGVGSIWFHATGASLVHDLGLALVVVTTAPALWRGNDVPSGHANFGQANFGLANFGLANFGLANFGLGILVVGLGVWWASRTGGPLCDPDSLLQGHAFWHVLAAVGAGLILYSAPTTSR